MLKPEPTQAVRVDSSLPDYFRRRLSRYAACQQRHIFRELTHGFVRMQELVAHAGSHADGDPGERILQLYARWMKSGDPAVAAQLRRLGVILGGPQGH